MTELHSKPHPRLLIVEGADDDHVIRHASERSGVAISFAIDACGGLSNLLSRMRTELRARDRESLGFVLDANNHPEQRWESISSRLSRAGIEAPWQPDPNGTIIPGDELNPTVGIWMMPDNKSPGELEDFVARMIPRNDYIWPLSKAYIEGISIEHRLFGTKEVRAKVLSWIATREDPGFMGQAIARGDLNTDTPLCQTFTAWLNRLFAQPDAPDPA